MLVKLKAYNEKKEFEKIIKFECLVAYKDYNEDTNTETLTILSINPREERQLIVDEFRDFILDNIYIENGIKIEFDDRMSITIDGRKQNYRLFNK